MNCTVKKEIVVTCVKHAQGRLKFRNDTGNCVLLNVRENTVNYEIPSWVIIDVNYTKSSVVYAFFHIIRLPLPASPLVSLKSFLLLLKFNQITR